MKIAVIGGLGLQGRAAVADLARSEKVSEVICADADLAGLEMIKDFPNFDKVRAVKIDAGSRKELAALLKQADAAIDLLPIHLMENIFNAAIEAGVSLVNTNYGKPVRHLHEAAEKAGISLMPECGLDPGIDLVLCGHAVTQFDELHVLNSYCGGIPEKSACDNPLNYKISWNWDMVITSQQRESVFIKNSSVFTIPPGDQHDNEMIDQINFPGLGNLETVPNGNAVFYTELLGVSDTIKHSGRYSLRWPGWCAFWAPLKKLDFFSNEPVKGLNSSVTPRQLMVKLLEPQLQYKDNEKDLAVMYNHFEGIKDGKKKIIKSSLLIERDMKTGLFAMSLGVGYTASIAAQMIASGEISRKGVLNPAADVPYESFMNELALRNIKVKEEVVLID
ncbi:Aaccharopine dehydrogenase [Desulfonema limicola]|uniref:Aaccharopine dehydrogenase n=1 Tax=Desulfonema limicola TaxID=45656 RepID=A0A975GHJ0_9BACT|nr:saccharopine dehydrogenase C-terminal domain-containing protein [Desulfonema limicola]QTA81540.1 Aaccharopine dehydrogenase [Desulfonema limicola]